MSKVKILDIDNAKLIGRLLPFWARGRKFINLLESIFSPLATAHKVFCEWAEDKYVASHITMQKPSMEWYLKYKLKKALKNPESNFIIIHGDSEPRACFSGVWNNDLRWDNSMLWENSREDDPYIEFSDNIHAVNVIAPAINVTLQYGEEDYKRDIRFIMERYMVSFKTLNIVIVKD